MSINIPQKHRDVMIKMKDFYESEMGVKFDRNTATVNGCEYDIRTYFEDEGFVRIESVADTQTFHMTLETLDGTIVVDIDGSVVYRDEEENDFFDELSANFVNLVKSFEETERVQWECQGEDELYISKYHNDLMSKMQDFYLKSGEEIDSIDGFALDDGDYSINTQFTNVNVGIDYYERGTYLFLETSDGKIKVALGGACCKDTLNNSLGSSFIHLVKSLDTKSEWAVDKVIIKVDDIGE